MNAYLLLALLDAAKCQMRPLAFCRRLDTHLVFFLQQLVQIRLFSIYCHFCRFPKISLGFALFSIEFIMHAVPSGRKQAVLRKSGMNTGIQHRRFSIIVYFHAFFIYFYINKTALLLIIFQTDSNRCHKSGIFFHIRCAKINLLQYLGTTDRHSVFRQIQLNRQFFRKARHFSASSDDKHRADRTIAI